MSTWPLLIFRSVGQKSVSKVKPILTVWKVKPILYVWGKGGISVLQTAIFHILLRWCHMRSMEQYLMNEWEWLFNVTCNDISVLYVTAQRFASGLEKKLNLRSGFQRHRHFLWFYNVPVQQRHGQPFLYGYSDTPPRFTTRSGYGGNLDLTPGPHGGTLLTERRKS